MAALDRKRKASSLLDDATKRLRIENSPPILEEHSLPSSHDDKEDEDGDYDYRMKREDSSEEDDAATTPLTPFSPVRKKFPSELKTIKCTYEGCTKTFNRPARLTSHLRTHTNERPYICTYEGCDKAYFEEKHLQAHIKGCHTHERAYKCDWEGCYKSFVTSTRLKRHKEIHEGHDRFRCTSYPPCNQTFRKHQTLQRHIRSDHLQLAPYPCSYIDPVTSELCDSGFDGAVGLRKHEERVHGAAEFFCPECTVPGTFNSDGTPIHLGFKTNSQLQSHIRKEHANCPFCDLRCSSQAQLQKHIDSLHSGKSLQERKNIPCSYTGCNKKFTKQGNLNIHIRTVHMGSRYICGSFDVSSHSNLKDFDVTDSCGKDFFSKVNLVDHIRTRHLGLPSIVNANRKKTLLDPDSEIEDEDEYRDRSKKKQQKKKKRAAKSKPSAIDQLLGNAYAADPSRTISCLVLDCPYKFIRQYDLQIHMDSVHRRSPQTAEVGCDFGDFQDLQFEEGDEGNFSERCGELAFGEEQAAEEMNISHDEADLDWELQRRALDGSPFWIGGEEAVDDLLDGSQDDWVREEMEIRRLVGGGDV